jgi:acyl carrier protein
MPVFDPFNDPLWAQRYVLDFLWRKFGTNADEITTSMSLEEFGVDSLDIVELVMEIEEETGLDVPDEGVKELRSVQDLIDLVKKLRGQSP